MQKINCSFCMRGDHEKCVDDDKCLCAEDKHGESLKNGVRVIKSDREPRVYEQALRDAQRLEIFEDEGIGNNSPSYAIIEYTKLLILSKHIISKFELVDVLKNWCKKYRIDEEEVDPAIEFVFKLPDVYQNILKITKSLGRIRKEINFDRTQLTEAAYWLMGRYNIKRIEVTGELLFWNDKYYESNAEAQIRRSARKCITQSKNADMVEIIKLVEDSCEIISWDDIEKSIHIKCLNNGIYNIKTGIFSERFNPDYIITNIIPHNYDEISKWDDIENIISRIITNKNDRESFYDFLSLCLHPYNGTYIQFGGLGIPGTGKSQLCKLAGLLFGKDNVTAAAIHLLAKDPTTQKDCAFKMLNIDEDLNDNTINHMDVLKKWITQDNFTARAIYEHESTFRPMSRLMFMANSLYEIPNEDDAEAIYERTHIIRINKKVRGTDKEIKNVIESVVNDQNLDAMITYLLKNATVIYNSDKIRHPMPFMEVERIWNIYGNTIRDFVAKYIERGVSFRTQQDEPWNKWMKYALDKQVKAKDKKEFRKIFDELVQNVPTKTRMDGLEVYAYSGFRIRTDEEVAERETIPINKEALKARYFFTSQIFLENFNKIFFNPKTGEL